MEGTLGDGRRRCNSNLPPLQVAYVLTFDPPQEHDDEIVDQIWHCLKWENKDICYDHILNSICNSLIET